MAYKVSTLRSFMLFLFLFVVVLLGLRSPFAEKLRKYPQFMYWETH
ncbi:hypothetical protein CsSME_00018228 [Camellia sinensis var. sinensis]